MRNLYILTVAAAGAWLMAHLAVRMGSELVNVSSYAPNPMSALLVGPAVILGGLLGCLLGSMVFPRGRY